MSKMFSVVTLASDSGLLEEYYAPGSLQERCYTLSRKPGLCGGSPGG